MRDGPVGRGGLKLEAGLARFGIAPRLRGARAVDVGASTGGFTEALLRHGAAHVVAVDVGHGQLHPSLRADPRVDSLEGTDWKTLALSVAPGPFDFFTVDVSFVAARNMLRSLAFRLRPGAEGVVLVKPQFELPDRLVRSGNVRDPALRARALDAFTKKAAGLGFTVVETIDSPVAGGSGTVEILAHLRFEGRTAKLPERGKQGGAGAPRRLGVPAPHRDSLSWFAVAAPGLEAVVRDEVARLPGAERVAQVEGGVEFAGGLEVGMAANLHLRVATRVLLRLGTVEARKFPELRRRVAKLSLRAFVPAGRPLRVDAAAARCRLYHTGAIEENVALALGDAVGRLEGAERDDEEATRLLVRGREDRFVVSLDASGALLHKRGWRAESGPAPLRETLAAGVLALAGHDPALPFVDPMCGAGTIALEACAAALGVAPGLARGFAFERWPCFDPAAWDRLRDGALAAIRDAPPAPLFAFDRDEAAVELARRNAGRAGLLAHLVIERAALGDRAAPAARGLVVVNPPYGRRLERGGAGPLLRAAGQALRGAYAGWRAAVLLADRAHERLLGLRAPAAHPLTNGGLRVRLLVGELPPARGAAEAVSYH